MTAHFSKTAQRDLVSDMRITDFTDDRIAAVLGGAPLTLAERSFLVTDTSTFEECHQSQGELSALNDADLMRAAYDVWADYASCL